jgi:hypothetical protein
MRHPNGTASEELDMTNMDSRKGNYVMAAFFGATVGGLATLILTRAIPRMISQMMAGMMRNMVTQMGEKGCNPSEI